MDVIACGSEWRQSSINSQPQLRQTREIIRPRAITPSEQEVAFSDRNIIDAGLTSAHQAVLGKFPVLIAMGSEPLTLGVVPLILETNSDTVVAARPDLFDQFVIQLFGPFAL